jgi:hypothetical protein
VGSRLTGLVIPYVIDNSVLLSLLAIVLTVSLTHEVAIFSLLECVNVPWFQDSSFELLLVVFLPHLATSSAAIL